MASSPIDLPWQEWFGESVPSSPRDSAPSKPVNQRQRSKVGSVTPTSSMECPIRRLSHQIDSYEKARVIAIMALEIFVYNGKFNDKRHNWACPFGDCKENFADANKLMEHVPECGHSSSDKVYCNSCGGYNCFLLHSHHHKLCGGESAECGERGSAKKGKTMRKLSNLFKSRPASRLGSPDEQSPVAGRRSPFSSVSPTSYSPAASPGKDVNAASGATAPQEMLAHPKPSELAGGIVNVNVTAELPTQEIEEMVTESSGLFFDRHLTASPPPIEDDLELEDATPSRNRVQKSSFSSTQRETSEIPYISATFFPSVSQPQSGLQSSWTHPHRAVPPPQPQPQIDLQFSASNGQSGIYSSNVSAAANQASLIGNMGINGASFVPRNSTLQPPSSNWQSKPIQTRHGSKDSYMSIDSNSTSGSWHSNPSAPPYNDQQPSHGGSPPAVPTSAADGMMSSSTPMSSSPPSGAEDIRCHICGFRPQGKPAQWRTYLRKHITNKHQSSEFYCPDCGKAIRRMDNLKAHQRNSCPGARFAEPAYQQFQWPTGQMRRHEPWDGMPARAHKRLRQGLMKSVHLIRSES